MIVEVLVATAIVASGIKLIKGIAHLADHLHNRAIFGKHQPTMVAYPKYKTYTFSQADLCYVERSKAVLKDILGDSPVQVLMSLGAEARMQAVKALCEQLAKLYGLEDLKVELQYDDNDILSGGAYSQKKNLVMLNAYHLLVDSEFSVQIFLSVIFHEFRHAVQWKMILDANAGVYSWYHNEERIPYIAYEYYPGNYISPEQNMEAYAAQYVEMDANEIARAILEDV